MVDRLFSPHRPISLLGFFSQEKQVIVAQIRNGAKIRRRRSIWQSLLRCGGRDGNHRGSPPATCDAMTTTLPPLTPFRIFAAVPIVLGGSYGGPECRCVRGVVPRKCGSSPIVCVWAILPRSSVWFFSSSFAANTWCSSLLISISWILRAAIPTSPYSLTSLLPEAATYCAFPIVKSTFAFRRKYSSSGNTDPGDLQFMPNNG